MRHRLLWLGALAWICLPGSGQAGTISITFSLTSGAGQWSTNQSGGMPISLSGGSLVVEVGGAGALTPTGSVATIQNLFATGIGPNLNPHSLQLFGLQAQLIGTGTGTLTASAGAGTVLGSVGGPSGVLPLSSAAAVLFKLTSVGASGSAGFQFLGGTFGGATLAQITQTVQGTEVARTFVPEPSSALLVALGLCALSLASGASLRATHRRASHRS